MNCPTTYLLCISPSLASSVCLCKLLVLRCCATFRTEINFYVASLCMLSTQEVIISSKSPRKAGGEIKVSFVTMQAVKEGQVREEARSHSVQLPARQGQCGHSSLPECLWLHSQGPQGRNSVSAKSGGVKRSFSHCNVPDSSSIASWSWIAKTVVLVFQCGSVADRPQICDPKIAIAF